MSDKPILFLVLFMLFLSIFYSSAALAVSEEEMAYLNMYFKDEELEVVSSTRSLKSISRVAENMTVVTASDIELMGAHTVADVLNTVNGVQVSFGGPSPGSNAYTKLQGSAAEHVTAFMDGIPLNDLANNYALLGGLPVQNIAKIEIIKGPASAAWGSSLGGVINIITKSSSNKAGGTLSASYGERNTGDFNAESYAKIDRFGYYLYAGRLQTKGLRSGFDFEGNHFYTKLTYDLAKNTNLVFTLAQAKEEKGNGIFTSWDMTAYDRVESILSSLSLNTAFNDDLKFSLSLRVARQFLKSFTDTLSTGVNTDITKLDDRKYGASAKLVWDNGPHTVILGTDFDHARLLSNKMNGLIPESDRWAFFANDTISLGRLSVTPGIRYDNTDTNGDFISPSLGATYKVFDKSLLRAYVARGFSTPSFGSSFGDNLYIKSNPDLKVEKVWSYQVGAETAALKYFWLKVSAFRHDITDAIVTQDLTTGSALSQMVNNDKRRRQGVEAEIKSVPVYNTSLSAGATFYDITNLTTGEKVRSEGKYTYDVGLKYDDEKTFRALVKGHYAWFDMDSFYQAQYTAFIFDMNLIKTLYQEKANRLEVFFTAHNIFNATHNWFVYYPNANRWIEGGLRYKF